MALAGVIPASANAGVPGLKTRAALAGFIGWSAAPIKGILEVRIRPALVGVIPVSRVSAAGARVRVALTGVIPVSTEGTAGARARSALAGLKKPVPTSTEGTAPVRVRVTLAGIKSPLGPNPELNPLLKPPVINSSSLPLLPKPDH